MPYGNWFGLGWKCNLNYLIYGYEMILDIMLQDNIEIFPNERNIAKHCGYLLI